MHVYNTKKLVSILQKYLIILFYCIVLLYYSFFFQSLLYFIIYCGIYRECVGCIIFHIFLQILNHLIWRHGGDSVLCKVLLGMQIPSARPNMLTIIGHFQTDIRNKRDKLRVNKFIFCFYLKFVKLTMIFSSWNLSIYCSTEKHKQ